MRLQLKRDRELTGRAVVGLRTKELLNRLEKGDIAVICHPDIDVLAAQGLIRARVKAVLNGAKTMTGTFAHDGPGLLVNSGIPVFEIAEQALGRIRSGMTVTIRKDEVLIGDDRLPCSRVTPEEIRLLAEQASGRYTERLSDFIDNTLRFAQKEKELLLKPVIFPELRTPMAGRHAVVVVRGGCFREDLYMLAPYLREMKPAIIAVDGAADALLQAGFVPDVIVGDMDSVSERGLRCGAQLVVQAYADGRAPGMDKLCKLGLRADVVRAPGTSEDVAMLMAYEKKAQLIVTVGSHSHMTDFLEKGRNGMASTLLVRMKIGHLLVDAKGVSRLYRGQPRLKDLWLLPAAGAVPLLALAYWSPAFHRVMDLFWIYIKLSGP